MTRRRDFVRTANGRVVRRAVEQFRIFPAFREDFKENVRRLIQRFLALRFRGFRHERFMNDEREVHGRRVHAVVEKALRRVQRGHAGLFFIPGEGHDKFVHAPSRIGDVDGVFQTRHEVIRIEHGHARRFRQSFPAESEDVRKGPHGDEEIAVEHAHPAAALLRRGE